MGGATTREGEHREKDGGRDKKTKREEKAKGEEGREGREIDRDQMQR